MAFEPATRAQQNYLEILLNERGFDRVRRNAWLSGETGKEIHFLDDLSKAEASRMIDLLKEEADDQTAARAIRPPAIYVRIKKPDG